MEAVMKINEFVKLVLVPILSVVFLVVLFRPLCMVDGEWDYLRLWFLSGIPFGVQRMSLWVIPKGYDIGGSMGVLAINLLVGSVIGGIVLTYRLLMAVIYLVKTALSGITWITKKVTAKPCKVA
jgi:hypothetical protein